jgi:aromatic-L-amino-acid/L-tryptophan decarboxylase
MNTLDPQTFRKAAHRTVDWMADYLESIEALPVRSPVNPGAVFDQLPDDPPAIGEPIESIMHDFRSVILPGMMHWQHPNFFAYFPANSSYPSVIAEMITATMGAQCMMWETSPAAAELEEKMMSWLRKMTGIPENFAGVIQDTASSSTLCAILSARERLTDFAVSENGPGAFQPFRVYCSAESHSSIEKDVRIAGIGKKNLVKVGMDDSYRMDPRALARAIEDDTAAGLTPLCVVATLGTTGSTAIDPLREIAEITSRHSLWLHVDAAFAGSALVLPEYRWMIDGIEHVDSFVFNPHKWMFTNFDCSAYFVQDPATLIRTFEVVPEYLRKHTPTPVKNYRDWGIPLGRRFRALKLWFVIRNFGVEHIRERLRHHIALAKELEQEIDLSPDFELLAPRTLSLVCFRYKPAEVSNEEQINKINELLERTLNDSGKLYLSHTKLDSRYTLRIVVGQTSVQRRHVMEAWKFMQEKARSLKFQ